MRGTTHLVFGLLLSAIAIGTHVFDRPLLAVALILLGSLLPDLDERHSKLGRRMPLVGWFIKHRTLFHSLPVLIALIVSLSFILPMSYVWAFSAAFVLHLVLDAMTPQGVQPLWPSKLRIRGFVRTGGVMEQLVFIAAAIAFVWLLLR